MPAKTTIFNTRAKATYTFPLKPRNTILFSPNGRFVLVAGFGNLAGQMDIHDLEKDYEKVCTIEGGNPSVCEWSPDGKYILTATTSPRLRVDNGVRVWHVGGALMYNEDMTELYHVCWRPQSPGAYPREDPLHSIPAPHPSATAYLGTKKTPSKPAGAYRPPGARGTTTPMAFRREDEGGAAFVSEGVPAFRPGAYGRPGGKREIPGAEAAVEKLPPGAAPGGGVSLNTGDGNDAVSKAASKNKKKREAKKAREAEAKTSGLAPDTNGAPEPSRSPERNGRKGPHEQRSRSKSAVDPRARSTNRTRSRAQSRAAPNQGHQNGSAVPPTPVKIATKEPAAAAAEAPDLTVTTPGGGGGTPQDKKLRGLMKKMRAIDDLKMRLAGGEKLEDTQMKKIATEEEVRRDLEGMGWNG